MGWLLGGKEMDVFLLGENWSIHREDGNAEDGVPARTVLPLSIGNYMKLA